MSQISRSFTNYLSVIRCPMPMRSYITIHITYIHEWSSYRSHRTHWPPAKPSNRITPNTQAISICIYYPLQYTVVVIQYLYLTSLNSNTQFLQTSHRELRGCVARSLHAKKPINIQNVFLSLHPNKNNKTTQKRWRRATQTM